MLKKLTIVLGMAVAVAGTTTVSSFVFVPEAHAGWYKKAKKATKKVGSKAKKGSKYIGRKANKGAKAVGRTAKKGGRKVWNNGGKAVVRRAAIAGAKVGEYEVRGVRAGWRGAKRAGKVARSVGKGFGKMGKCMVMRNCKNTIGPAQPGTRSNYGRRS